MLLLLMLLPRFLCCLCKQLLLCRGGSDGGFGNGHRDGCRNCCNTFHHILSIQPSPG
jgi:hypothetical protein